MFKKILGSIFPSAGKSLPPVDPAEILFSLPTINDEIPDLEANSAADNVPSLHEDDWKQIEFFLAKDADYIVGEIIKLVAFKRQHRVAAGYKEVYIRGRHPTALRDCHITNLRSMSMNGGDLAIGGNLVSGGFSFTGGNGWMLYGRRNAEGAVLDLGIHPGTEVLSQDEAVAISRFAVENRLLLADWVLGAVVEATSVQALIVWSRNFQR